MSGDSEGPEGELHEVVAERVAAVAALPRQRRRGGEDPGVVRRLQGRHSGRRRIDGRWLIVHDHESVPFDPASGQALIDLEP